MTISELNGMLSGRNFRMYYFPLAKSIGLTNAIALQRILHWIEWFEEEKEKNDLSQESLFLTDEKLAEDTCLTIYQVREAKNFLTKAGLIETQVKGIPPRTYYTANILAVVKFCEINKLILRNQQINFAKSQKRSCEIAKYSYKERNKKEKKEAFAELGELNKTGSYLPTKKQLETVFKIDQYKAKQIEKELKNIDSLDKRKTYLQDLLQTGIKPQKAKFERKKTIYEKNEEIDPEEAMSIYRQMNKTDRDYFDLIVNVYRKALPNSIQKSFKPSRLSIIKYAELLNNYEAEQILYIAKNTMRAVAKGGSYYSVSLDNLMKPETISRFIADPLLAECQKEAEADY